MEIAEHQEAKFLAEKACLPFVSCPVPGYLTSSCSSPASSFQLPPEAELLTQQRPVPVGSTPACEGGVGRSGLGQPLQQADTLQLPFTPSPAPGRGWGPRWQPSAALISLIRGTEG